MRDSLDLYVKNTFFCIMDEEGGLGHVHGRKRASTDGAALERDSSCSTAGCSSDVEQVCEDMLNVFERSEAEAFPFTVDDLQGVVVALSKHERGSALLLSLLDESRREGILQLSAEFKGFVREAAMSEYAHQVLLKFLRCLGSTDVGFISEELLGSALECALDESGSEVFVNLVMFNAHQESTGALIDELLMEDLPMLCNHKNGHEVLMALLSNGSRQQQEVVVLALGTNLKCLGRQRFASRVVAQALLQCPSDMSAQLATDIMAPAAAVVSLACHSFGVDVVRALLEVLSTAEQTMFYLRKGQRKIRKDKFGVVLLNELGLTENDAQ